MIAPSARLAPTTDRRHYVDSRRHPRFPGYGTPYHGDEPESSPVRREHRATRGHGPVPGFRGRTQNVAMCMHGPLDPRLLGYHDIIFPIRQQMAHDSVLIVGERSSGEVTHVNSAEWAALSIANAERRIRPVCEFQCGELRSELPVAAGLDRRRRFAASPARVLPRAAAAASTVRSTTATPGCWSGAAPVVGGGMAVTSRSRRSSANWRRSAHSSVSQHRTESTSSRRPVTVPAQHR